MAKLMRSGDSPQRLLSELAGASPRFESIVAEGVFGDASLRVVIDGSGNRAVTRQSPVDPARIFGREAADTAIDAWQGDVDSALSLPGEWTVTVEQDLSTKLCAYYPNVRWQVLPTIGDFEVLFADAPVWSLGPTLDTDSPTIFVIEELDDGQSLTLGNSAVVPLASDSFVLEAAKLTFETPPGKWGLPELPESPSPAALAPAKRTGSDLEWLENAMWIRCATMSWAGLATSVKLQNSGSQLALEVFGLQRVEHLVNPQGALIPLSEAPRAFDLYRWASGSGALDQRLAVQQVASLYRDVPPWENSNDVFDAALAVFANLRRDAVSEVLLARRAARTLAIDVAQRVTESASAIARSAIERCVATLLAIGGVIVAQTTSAITADQASDLRGLLAIFLVGLAVWNIFVEGPPARSPLKSLRSDLGTVADLLTPRERHEIMELEAVKSALRRTKVIQIAVPSVYVVAAIAAWLVH
ncbi:hypothetical protein [Brevibacterium sediminis]